MRSFVKTAWNVLKPILTYYLIALSYVAVIAVIYNFIWEYQQASSGVLIDMDLMFETLLNNHMAIGTIIAAVSIFLIYSSKMRKRDMNIFEVYRFKKLPLSKAIASLIAGMTFMSMSFIYIVFAYFLDSSILEPGNGSITVQGITLLGFIKTGLIAPIIEEFIFRGIIFYELQSKTSIKRTILIQGILFGIFHINPFMIGISSVFGVFLGLIYIWTGSIWAPILMHIGNNLFLSLLRLNPNFLDKHQVLFLIILGVTFLALPFSLFYLYKNRVNFIPRNLKQSPKDCAIKI